MQKLMELVTQFPKTVIFLILAITVFFGSQMIKLKMETDPDIMIPKDHPAIVYRDKVEEIFGVRDAILVGVENDGSSGIFNPTTLAKVARITEKLKKLKGLDHQNIISLSTLDNIVGAEEGMEVRPFMETVPTTTAEIERLKNDLLSNEMYVGAIVSKDGTATLIIAEMKDSRHLNETMKAIYPKLMAIIKEERDPEAIYVAGLPVMRGVVSRLMRQDMAKLFPIVILVITGVLFLTFRSVRGLVLPLLVVVISIIWTMGLMGLTNVPATVVSSLMPIILMAIGVADGIHILSKYYDETLINPERGKRAIVLDTMREMWPPVVMTSLTSAAGFLTMLFAGMPPIRQYGIFTSVGILAAMVFSLFFIPASLMLLKVRQRKTARRVEEAGLTAKILAWTGNTMYNRRKAVAVSAVAVLFASAAGLTVVKVDSSFVHNFKQDSEIVKADRFINTKFGGRTTLNVILEATQRDAIKSPVLLQAMDELQKSVEEVKEVGNTISIAEYLKRMNKVLNEDNPAFDRIPDSQELVAQYLLLYSMSGDPDDFTDLVDYDYQQANVRIQMKTDRTAVIQKVIDRVQSYAAAHFEGSDIKVNLAGSAVLNLLFVDFIVNGQKVSLSLVIIAVFLITSLMFRSVTAGLFSIVPISLATLFNFGVMGLLGIPIDMVNAFMAGIGIGIGIDYTIHFISKYKLKAKETQNARELTTHTMATSGKAIFFNAVVVIAGFMVLLGSSIPPNMRMGALVSLNMLTSFLGAMTVLPALLNLIKPKFVFAQ